MRVLFTTSNGTGLGHLTRSMAIDEGPFGIRVNAVSPGIIDSGRPDIEAGKQDPEFNRRQAAAGALLLLGSGYTPHAPLRLLTSALALLLISRALIGPAPRDNG